MKFVYSLVAGGCLGMAVFSLLFDSAHPLQASPQADEPQKQGADDEPSELSVFMRKKLDASNLILEGLVTDNLDLVDEGAEKLLKMSDAEHWRASNDMMYMQHSREFRASVDTVQQKAKRKSIDGAALAWVDVTLSCIRCHEWVRDAMLAESAEFDPAGSVRDLTPKSRIAQKEEK